MFSEVRFDKLKATVNLAYIWFFGLHNKLDLISPCIRFMFYVCNKT